MLATIVYNGAVDYALIFGHFGAPRLGILGAGIASASSYVFCFFGALAVVYATPQLRQYRIFRRFFRPHWRHLGEIFHLGLPIGATMMAEGTLFNASLLLMGAFGAAAVAAHQISLNPPSITFMVPLGIATAATVRVGHAAGRGDGAGVRRAGYAAMMLAVAFMASAASHSQRSRAALPVSISTQASRRTRARSRWQHCSCGSRPPSRLFDGLQVVAALCLGGSRMRARPCSGRGRATGWRAFPCACVRLRPRPEGIRHLARSRIGLSVAAASMYARFYVLSRERQPHLVPAILSPGPLGQDAGQA